MNTAMIWAIGIVICVVFAPLVVQWIRDWDFKRQVSGKKPVRKPKKEDSLLGEEQVNLDVELMKEQTKIQSRHDIHSHPWL